MLENGPMMSATLTRIQQLVEQGEVKISEHGYDELSDDLLGVAEILEGVRGAKTVEDYPTFGKGPSVLVLQLDRAARPVHVVWGIPKGHDGPAVLVTAYRPDSAKWDGEFMERLK